MFGSRYKKQEGFPSNIQPAAAIQQSPLVSDLREGRNGEISLTQAPGPRRAHVIKGAFKGKEFDYGPDYVAFWLFAPAGRTGCLFLVLQFRLF